MDQTMTASNSQAGLDTTGDDHLPDDQELTAATHSGDEDALAGDQALKPGRRFGCPHCSKTYTTKKSLTRHLSSAKSACARQHSAQSQPSASEPKTRWACSRCGKDCATTHSVERHIEKSCWRTCDECAANGVTRCDSTTKEGPCRTCEAKEKPCTKHTTAIQSTVPQPWVNPAPQSQQMSPVNEVAALTKQQNPTKRKAPSSPKTSPEEAHQDKRKVPATESATDFDLGRVYDPLGGEAYVPPMVKKKAVSSWLQGQLKNDGSSATSTRAHTQSYSPMLSQSSSAQLHDNSQQYVQFVEPSQVFDRTLPTPANAFASLHARGNNTANHEHVLPRPPPPQAYQTSGYRSTAYPHVPNMPNLPPFGGRPLSTSGGPGQLDHLFRQMQATRRQNEAHDFEMAMRFGPRNEATFTPSFGMSGPLNLSSGHQTTLDQSVLNTPLSQTFTRVDPNKKGSVLTLRIHSNIHDVNGQPIFSILRIHRDQAFGPRLDAYCAIRGKEYGVHWVFVYRYPAATYQNPEQEIQITLTWDMTPNDIKDSEFPDMTMRDLDTIYVMQAKPFASDKTNSAPNEGGAVQSPGPQVSHEMADMTAGETRVFQNPQVSHDWYRAVEQDSTRLRAIHSTLQSTILKTQQDIFAKNNLIAQQKHVISQLTSLSAQLRQRMQLPLPLPNPTTQAPTGHVVRQRPGPPHHQPAQRRSNADPTVFVAKCEAVRDQQEQAAPRREPLQFPGGSDEFGGTGYFHQGDGSAEYDAQFPYQGCVYDAADKVVGESDVQEMDEE